MHEVECRSIQEGSPRELIVPKMGYIQKQVFKDCLLSFLDNSSLDCSYYGYRLYMIACHIYNLSIDTKKYIKEGENRFKQNISIQRISDELAEVLKITEVPYEEDTINYNLQCLKDVFDLNNVAFDILSYLSVKNTDPIRGIVSGLRQYYRTKFKNVSIGSITLILRDLYNKGLISTAEFYDDSLSLQVEISDIIDSNKILGKKEVSERLLGTPKIPELSLSNFKHIKSDKAIKILKNGNKGKGINILLYGSIGCGKTSFARTIAKKANLELYEVKTELDNFKEAKREDRLSDLYRKQYITKGHTKACILFDESEDVLNRGWSDAGTASKGFMNKILEETETPVIWTTNNITYVDPAFLRRMTYCIEFKKPTKEQRLSIWKRTLDKEGMKISNKTLQSLNESYNVQPSVITNAIKTVRLIGGNEDDFAEIIESVANVIKEKKTEFNNKETSFKNYNLSLLNTDRPLDSLTNRVLDCKRLDFSICMSGQPGTGKSLYARYLADKLKLKIITKRASDLLSMWVGGTETNIAEAFREATENKAVLIIDEADSFFQDRKNASHSWEVTQVNELLTQMEDFKYPFICTTNFADSLDEASLRRFTFKIHFNYMTDKQVKEGLKHFFKINSDIQIKGLTPGDFANVKKQAEFFKITDKDEIIKLLMNEVKVKKDKDIHGSIGF